MAAGAAATGAGVGAAAGFDTGGAIGACRTGASATGGAAPTGPTVSLAEASMFSGARGAAVAEPGIADGTAVEGTAAVEGRVVEGTAAGDAAGGDAAGGAGRAGDAAAWLGPAAAGAGRAPWSAAPGIGCPEAAFGSGASDFSTCLGAGTASTRCAAVAETASPSPPVATCLRRKAPPSTTAARAKNRRLRGRERPSKMAPGGTDSELGFCAGVSSLLGWRRAPAVAFEVRESRVRTGAPSLPDAAPAGGATELRAVTSAGLSRPVCVTVREGTGAGDAFGRDGVLLRARRECGRGEPLGVDRRLGGALTPASAAGATLARSDTATGGGTELIDLAPWFDAPPSSDEPLPSDAEPCAPEPSDIAPSGEPSAAAGGSEPERAPTV